MIEILRTRRSIRKYEKKGIDKDLVDVLKEALLRCPSAGGINPWTFIFVDDHELLQRLSQAKERGSTFLKDAALGIVVCGDETKSDVWVEDCSITSIVVQLTAHSVGLGTHWIQIRNRFHSGKDLGKIYPGTPRYTRALTSSVPDRHRLSRGGQNAPSLRKTRFWQDKI